MKKSILFALCVLFCLGSPSFAAAEGRHVKVSIPNFSVTVNGVEYNSRYSEYPFLLYNDITYMPITYDFAEFMGLSITFCMSSQPWRYKGEMILHVGSEERTASELGQYLKKKKNRGSYKAVVPDYHTYIMFDENEYDNSSRYPIINFNGVTYLPLTWEITHTLLDWDYSFGHDSGLVINSTGAIRPHGPNQKLFNTNMPGSNASEYVLGEHCYVRYDKDIYYGGNLLWVSGNETKEYHLTEQLKGKINYFNCMYINDGWATKAEIPPKIDGSIFEIMCMKKDFGLANVLVTIDLESGVVLNTEVLN